MPKAVKVYTTINNPMLIDIATGRSRKTVKWQNQKTEWAKLVEKLSVTHRTAETLAQYKASSRERQAEIKDIGGFVGGYLTGGRRTPVTNVKHRQLLTLDIDFGREGIWEDFTLIYDVEALVYSTHKHEPENPRLRLIIPLDRPVCVEAYEAISRRLADHLGMECFDSTTFEPQRLMYWASTPKDGEFYFRHQEGPFLSVDSILNTYVNWKDVSEWPISDAENLTVKTGMKQAGEPTEKPGLIGAFCRAYDIQSAIETFLPDVYEGAGEGRYTFLGGSSASGAVVYNEGSFLYSHHNTDPAHGKLLNAFDLVRIHRFGHMDEDKDGQPSKLKSHEAMSGFAADQKAVAGQIMVFDEYVEDESGEWRTELAISAKTGKFNATIDNIKLILKNDPKLKGVIAYDEFNNAPYALSDLPWSKVEEPRLYLDSDDSNLRHYLEKGYSIFHTGKTNDAVTSVAVEHKFHPVRDFIQRQEWDGVKRLETLLIDYLGAEDSEFVRTVTRKTFTAAVARVFNPGCKFDYVLTLVGMQGLKKSTVFDKLGGSWFSDSFNTVIGNKAFEQLQGSWIIEMAELSGLKKADVESVKHFISKRKDKFRVAYGKRTEEFPRQCIFLATTNEGDFLKDYTGNRRFWPVRVSGVSVDIQSMPVEQMWAEAKHCFDQGEKLYLDERMEAQANSVQSRHTESDERSGMIESYLTMLLPADWDKMSMIERRSHLSGFNPENKEGTTERTHVCVAEIWVEVFGKPIGEMNTANTKYIHQIMYNMSGWQKMDTLRSYGPYGRQRGYEKINAKQTNAKTTKRTIAV